VDAQVETYLRSFGGLLIEGPKWCGKTWTGRHHSRSEVHVDDQKVRQHAELDPDEVLAGDQPRLVDEWQDAPHLWDKARRLIDDAPRKGLFIFTGSAVPPLDATTHSGTGRFARLRMRPLSLFESGDSNGVVSLKHLLGGGSIEPVSSTLSYPRAVHLICRGGWPGQLTVDEPDAAEIPSQYVAGIAESDISRVDGTRRDPAKVAALLRSLARHVATPAKVATIHADVNAQESHTTEVSLNSVRSYLSALERVFVVDDLPAWRYALRSKTQLRAAPKRHLADPSLAVAALEATPRRLEADPETVGLLFESLCIRDLRIYAQANHGKVFHYRDANGLEADAIVSARDGDWGAVEVKLDWQRTDEAAASLLRLKDKLVGAASAPVFLMILTATGGVAHTRPDGVHVVPLDCLGP